MVSIVNVLSVLLDANTLKDQRNSNLLQRAKKGYCSLDNANLQKLKRLKASLKT